MVPIFHLAIPVTGLAAARSFYGGTLGLSEGRSAEHWIDYNFYGHQLSCHLLTPAAVGLSAQVDDKAIPIPHFGLVLSPDQFQQLEKTLTQSEVDWVHPPMTRFQAQPGEQRTMFVRDGCGNTLEFKSFDQPEAVWQTT